MIEQLESRQLFTVIVEGAERVPVLGTDGADLIRVTQQGDLIRVSVNGVVETHHTSKVYFFRIEAGDGDDRIVIGRNVNHESYIAGEAGRDTIIGGWFRDHINGGAGDDQIHGRRGDDGINGDEGNDLLVGGDGDDGLDGWTGDDRLHGGSGKDSMTDRQGHNGIHGGRDADVAWCLPNNLTSGIESQNFHFRNGGAIPLMTLCAFENNDGSIVIQAEASHWQGGYERHFGEMTATDPNTFTAQVTGTDLANGKDRGQAVESDVHFYDLGKLSPGAYTFTARSGDEVLAILHFRVAKAGGLTPGTTITAISRYVML